MLLWTVLLYLLTISSNTSKKNIFWNSCRVLKKLVFRGPNKSFSNSRFSFICWIHFNVIYFQKHLKKSIVKLTTLINIYFIWLASFWDYFWNALAIIIPLLSFKGTTLVYLLKISIAHNKYLIPLLYLLIDCVPAESTPQILSLKDE